MTAGRVLLAMPCAHGLVKMGAAKTLADSSLVFERQGYDPSITLISSSDIVMGRNLLAHEAVRHGYSHLFFLDSDMRFPPYLVQAMLDADKDVIGLIYPKREIDLDTVIELSRADPKLPASEVVSKALNYIVKISGSAKFSGGIGQVAGLGMGGCLIKTSVFQVMLEKKLVLPRAEFGNEKIGTPWGYFDPIVGKKGGMMSEDYSFCARWIKCGGEIWGVTTDDIGHVGDFIYAGNLLVSRGQRTDDDAPVTEQ